jgi:hypothetical protein
VGTLVLIFFLHFLADFILQPYWMKIEKSRRWEIMLFHIVIYSNVFFVGLSFVYNSILATSYALVNGFIHYLIDWASSRVISVSSKDLKIKEGPEPLYERVDMYYPIIFLGIDQYLHHICIIITWYYMLF